MTTTLSNRLNAGPIATEQARLAAQVLDEAAPRQWAGEAAGHTVKLGPEPAPLLPRTVRSLATGGTVTIGSIPDVLTTTAAAELLGISRPTLMKHITAGEL